jgi:hypothetical protein
LTLWWIPLVAVNVAKVEKTNFSHALTPEAKKIFGIFRGATSRALSQETPFALETRGVPKVFRSVFNANGAISR